MPFSVRRPSRFPPIVLRSAEYAAEAIRPEEVCSAGALLRYAGCRAGA